MKRIYLITIVVLAICTVAAVQSTSTTSTRLVIPAVVAAPLNVRYNPKILAVAAAPPYQKPPKPPAAVPPVSVQASSSNNLTEPLTGIDLQKIPGGCYQMGDSFGDTDEVPVHQVCLDSFYVGKYEVTQGQWLKIMGNAPSFFSFCGDDCPVENVSWNDVQEFISKLNRLNSGGYRLMTEAEWEYACRSGGKSQRFCGGDSVDAAAWYDMNSSSKTHQVGEKRPNGLGIYDMSGNVWEWVSDLYQKDYYGAPQVDNPQGPLTGSKRVMRGGSWYNDHKNVGASIRGYDSPEHRSINLGFRIVYSIR